MFLIFSHLFIIFINIIIFLSINSTHLANLLFFMKVKLILLFFDFRFFCCGIRVNARTMITIIFPLNKITQLRKAILNSERIPATAKLICFVIPYYLIYLFITRFLNVVYASSSNKLNFYDTTSLCLSLNKSVHHLFR